MAILSVTELPERSGSLNQKNERTYRRVFQVESDLTTEAAYDVRAAVASVTGTIGASYGSDPLAFLIDFAEQQTSEDGLTWEVTVSYGKLEIEEPDPTERDIDVSWNFTQFQRSLERDVNGKPIRNSANDPFGEALVRDDSRPVLTISRNESSFSPALAWFYRDATNADTFWGAPRGTCKVSNISATLQRDQEFGEFWRVTYEFHFNQAGWSDRVLDQGYNELVGGEPKKIKDSEGLPITEPALLDGVGGKLAADDSPVFRRFEKYPRLPFAAFNLE